MPDSQSSRFTSMKIVFLTTGGTIDKVYFDAKNLHVVKAEIKK